MRRMTATISIFALALIMIGCSAPSGPRNDVGYYPSSTGADLRAKYTGATDSFGQQGGWVYWYPNGKAFAEGIYRNGERHGEWTVYWPTGALREHGSFRNDIPHGTWTIHDRDGTLLRQVEVRQAWEVYYKETGQILGYAGDEADLKQMMIGMKTARPLCLVLHDGYEAYDEPGVYMLLSHIRDWKPLAPESLAAFRELDMRWPTGDIGRE